MAKPTVHFSVKGSQELTDAIRALPSEMQKQVILPAVKESAVPLTRKLEEFAPRSMGRWSIYRREHGKVRLSKTIGISVKSRRKKRLAGDAWVVLARVGPMYPPGAHAHLNEFGTVQRKTKKGFNRGIMPAKPWVRPAWQATQDEVWRRFSQVCREKLPQAVSAAAKAGQK